MQFLRRNRAVRAIHHLVPPSLLYGDYRTYLTNCKHDGEGETSAFTIQTFIDITFTQETID